MAEEIQRADPKARRKAFLFLLLGVSCALLAASLLDRYRSALVDWVVERPEATAFRLFVVLGTLEVVLAGFLGAVAFYTWRLGTRVLRAERFPPPGFRVVRDTAVLRGEAARRRAQVLRFAAALLAVAAAVTAVLFWQIWRSLVGT